MRSLNVKPNQCLCVLGSGVLLAVSGCRAPAPGNAVQDGSSVKSGVAGAIPQSPQPAATMTVTQAMGVGVLKALNTDPAMKGHKISVGTGPGTVWLNGSVPKPQQRALAMKIAQKKIPQAKIINALKVEAGR